jgi:hypothetical protein
MLQYNRFWLMSISILVPRIGALHKVLKTENDNYIQQNVIKFEMNDL